ncbi:MAG: hypothetical protein OSB21_04640, partial [Myxococcota bacterium]|nr:hypothetical protein [Myxococcota bacterium]
ALNPSLLNRWAFYQRKASSVVIQIGITYGHEVCRGQLTKILIELPIPPALTAHLEAADQRKTLRQHLEYKPKPPPAEAGLEVVHVQGGQLFTTNLKTKKTKALNLGKRKVLTAGQDADGHWWVVTQRGKWIELARIPIGLEAHRRKPLLGQMQAGTGHYKLVFPDKTTFTMTDFSTRRNAAERCGDWTDKWLCDESMGWTEHKTRTYPLKKERLAEWGIPIPSQATKPVVTSGPPPKPFRRVPCQCWGSDFGCGKSTPLGNTGLRLLVTDVECGDLAHPSCVAESADKRSYALFSFADLAKNGSLKWISGDKITPKKEGPFGSCGPFYFSADGRWVTDGKGVFCTLDQPAVCTPKLKGDFLGTTGLPLRVTELR